MALYSHSRLKTFEQCRLRFKFKYIDRIEAEWSDTIEQFLGSRVHEALEKLYKDLKFKKLNKLPELLAYYNDIWEKNWHEGIHNARKEYTEENFRKLGEQFIKDYYERFYPFNQSRTIGLETQYSVALDEDNKYKIHIRIDRLAVTDDDSYEVHDYKTANSLPTQQDVDKDKQLAIYAFGIKKLFQNVKRVRLIWHYLAFNKSLVSERTDRELEELRKELIRQIKLIESCESFEPTESALCNWCEFQNICPRFKHRFETEKLSPEELKEENGFKLVGSYAKLKAEISEKEEALEEIRQKLIEYSEKNSVEAIYGPETKAIVRSYTKLSFPSKGKLHWAEFKSLLKKIGLWEAVETVNGYELAKIINNRQIPDELIRLIEPYITKSKQSRIWLSRK